MSGINESDPEKCDLAHEWGAADGQEQCSDVGVATKGESPLVSVVMAVYNAGEYLRPAVSSVLNQTYRNLDIIIVDDGSTDDCLDTITDLLEDGRIRVLRQENATRPVALNRALDLAQGEFYAIQDADDISDPTRIQKQVNAILSHPRVAVVFCGYWVHMRDKCVAPVFHAKDEAECKDDIDSYRSPSHDATGLYRMSMVGRERYDSSLPYVEAIDYILRVGESYPMIVLEDCLYGYRAHPSSLTQSNPDRRDQMVVTLLRRACERRGQSYEIMFPQMFDTKRRSRNTARDNGLGSVFVESVVSQRQTGRRLGALKTGFHCARLHPFDRSYYKALAYAIGPAWLQDAVRTVKRLGK